MKPTTHLVAALAATVLLAAAPALAHDHGPPPAGASFTSDLLSSLDGASGKLVQLAKAIPAAHYGWSPAEGVRSISEVLMHVAAANYFIASRIGGPAPPEGVRELEKETDKAKVVAALEESIAIARAAVEATAASATADESLELFGMKMSQRRTAMLVNDHAHEHLGQLIAYARAVGIAPPWSTSGDEG
jgi:uncharacterized damage-inducible protein DinB